MNLIQLWPVAMFLRCYSFCVLLLDLSYFMLYTFAEMFLAVLHVLKPPSRKDITSEVALVIGAARGIGRELSLALAALGAEVVCIDISSVGNEATVKEIRVQKGRAHAYTSDVTNNEMITKTVNTVEKNIGPISFLFHCCALPSPRSYTSESPPIKTTMDLLETLLPRMKQRRHGHIVLLTSVAGIKQHMPFSVSQFAVQGLFKSLNENIRLDRLQYEIFVSLVHIYPFVVSKDPYLAHDISLRIPNWTLI